MSGPECVSRSFQFGSSVLGAPAEVIQYTPSPNHWKDHTNPVIAISRSTPLA